jgi:gluconate 2-dehydrogenase gamma chain
MDRRKSLKLIGLGTVSSGLLLDACKEPDKKTAQNGKEPATPAFTIDRNPQELERDKKLIAEKFFTDQEMATIAVLTDIIIPKDEVSGSATDAKVPDFIGFIVNDMPHYQVPMRGGLRWLDIQCMKKYDKGFKDCSKQQQLEMVDLIAYPERAKDKKDLAPGVSFFSLLRNLTATGFYSSAIGIKDVGYAGNVPNKWNGVPDDVLKQYGLAYTEKELKECVTF